MWLPKPAFTRVTATTIIIIGTTITIITTTI
jgi:hypothetical protein